MERVLEFWNHQGLFGISSVNCYMTLDNLFHLWSQNFHNSWVRILIPYSWNFPRTSKWQNLVRLLVWCKCNYNSVMSTVLLSFLLCSTPSPTFPPFTSHFFCVSGTSFPTFVSILWTVVVFQICPQPCSLFLLMCVPWLMSSIPMTPATIYQLFQNISFHPGSLSSASNSYLTLITNTISMSHLHFLFSMFQLN